ncbi:putative nucleotidyltransferase-like protein [Agromyces ramosus]|uniref:Putative nucleotidyltransferase-like protein n=1 Tax=Agromyces ramosus TaxID=33879 RepID=A0A4Q7M9Q1_9MICO|nr:nucleotidyltransferase family protein [Agromyces ramosus]RZS63478.1 putative nucleotidyltransferase-like protein [Agromyces ramosus]
MNETQVSVPLPVRLRFGHAAVQHLADSIGVDLLHIKGVAADASLRPDGDTGSDVDVLVRPDHVARLDAALRRNGWRLYSTFELGSPFGHAQTYLHDAWGYIDIHRLFPGIRVAPERAFDRLWSERLTTEIAGVACAVPTVPAQALLLILNAARSTGSSRRDMRYAWDGASSERRAEIEALVRALDAEVGFAATVGGLERFKGERDYRLWKVVSRGGSRSEEWWGRMRAAPTLSDAVRIAVRAPLVNVEHLAFQLGRRPSRREIAIEFVARPARAVGEAWRALFDRRSAR